MNRSLRHAVAFVAMLCLTFACASPVAAKDVPLTSLWSGAWQTAEGDRCSLRITKSGGEAAVVALCTFGSAGVSAETPLIYGVPIPLSRAGAELGGPPTAPSPWGELSPFAVCDFAGPLLYTSVIRYTPAAASWKEFRPVRLDYADAATLCGGGTFR